MLAHHSLLLIGAVILANLVALPHLARPLQSWPTVVGTALATVAVVLAALLCQQLLQRALLQPLQLHYLRWLTLLLMVAAFTQLATLLAPVIKPWHADMHRPLLLSHSALLSIALLDLTDHYTAVHAMRYSAATACGCALLIPLWFALRERSNSADVPVPLRGAAIDMLSAGLIALAFMGFAGIF
jgi:Na+-translocating ferredoxin:NAD+ oxidoreductase subunit A